MNLIVVAYAAILFFVLTPGILVSLPPKSSKMMVAATHAIIFALVLGFTCKMVWKFSMRFEGFSDGAANAIAEAKPDTKKGTVGMSGK
jgi:hypothetical protein